jgi:hypothetical protein
MKDTKTGIFKNIGLGLYDIVLDIAYIGKKILIDSYTGYKDINNRGHNASPTIKAKDE